MVEKYTLMDNTCLIKWEQTTENNKNWYQQCLFDYHIDSGSYKSGTPNKLIYIVVINFDCTSTYLSYLYLILLDTS